MTIFGCLIGRLRCPSCNRLGARSRRMSTTREFFRLLDHVQPGQLECADAFQYTSGRWLYNESKRLEERYLNFNVPALVNAAALSVGRKDTDVQSIQKMAEGGFNRVFELTMKDGFQLIARLPYPSTQPKRLATGSEVATMDLVRSHEIPAPQIYDYSADADNAVGVEYILMEKVRGRPLGGVWFHMSDKERIKILSGIVDIETKLFGIDLPAHGSIFYYKDLPRTMGRQPLQPEDLTDQFCIGPDVSLKFWFEERSTLQIPRTPFSIPEEVLLSVATKEMAWIREYGKPRLPFDRVYRDITNYQNSDPHEHLRSLKLFTRIVRQLVPQDEWLHRPTIRHPDLNPNNIFVNDNFDITGIIDWQHSTVLPLFLHAGIPSHFQNYGDPDSESLNQPQLPADLEEMDEEDREKDLELYRRRHLHFYYVGATAKKNDLHFRALMHEGGHFRRKIFQHAGEPWEGNNIALKADLIRVQRSWSELVSYENKVKGVVPPCPISFDEHEAEEMLQAAMEQEEADDQMEILRNAIGINIDGGVSHEGYEDAVAKVAEMKAQAISYAENDVERDITTRHWPFDDHDEKE